ncbi:MAG: hypothetical protein KF764_29865 [Labilithrix sp.]|nr:hypothetical protein [Labilithrix sp.]MBX3223491.1 hypothetical protein [Labilithrix sp.]
MREPLVAAPPPLEGTPLPGAAPHLAPAPVLHAVEAPALHRVLPPAERARRIALGISVVAIAFSLGCGFCGRRAFALREAAPDDLLPWVAGFLVLLLVALLLRMAAAICEILWLERTWSNLPEPLRKVGPIHDVSSAMAIAVSFLPGVAWVWKLGLVVAIANGFESVRAQVPFTAPVPKRLGMAAVIVGWIPGLNVYVAPFLWEMFATRIDACVRQIMAGEQA